MTENEPEPRPPSPALAGIAAAMPALFFGLSCGLYGATLIGVGPGGGASVVQTIREMGLASFALIGASGLMGAIGAGVCLLLAGRGKRVPAAVTVAMAILPWLMGLAFTAFGLDSIKAFALTGDLAEWLDRELPATLFWDYPNIETLAAYVCKVLGIEE